MAVIVERVARKEAPIDVVTHPLLPVEGLREVLLQLLVLQAVVVFLSR